MQCDFVRIKRKTSRGTACKEISKAKTGDPNALIPSIVFESYFLAAEGAWEASAKKNRVSLTSSDLLLLPKKQAVTSSSSHAGTSAEDLTAHSCRQQR